MKTQEFKQILAEVKNMDIPAESAVHVAEVILQESGKDRRAEMCNRNRYNSNGYSRNYGRNIRNGNEPATDGQKNAMDNFRIEYSEDITKAEASRKLEQAIEEAKSRKKGRTSPASSSSRVESDTRDMDTADEEWCPYCDSEYHDESICPALASLYSF